MIRLLCQSDSLERSALHSASTGIHFSQRRVTPSFTLPPFVPNRVIAQEHYDRVATNNDNYELSNAPPLHIRQRSEENFKRFIRRTTNDGTIIWFSSGSRATGRGSIMVYNVSPEMKFGWHATFLKKARWQIEKATFTSKALVEGLRDSGSGRLANKTAFPDHTPVGGRNSVSELSC